MKNYSTRNPILVTVFNRPDNLKDTLNRLVDYSPPIVYVAVDGPRSGNKNDLEANLKIRTLLEEFNHVPTRTLIQDSNLGAKWGMISALSWFFANEIQGIILEDDIQFSDNFLRFADAMLQQFHDNTTVAGVNGWTPMDFSDSKEFGFYFTKYPFIWGWATWRRTWQLYMQDLPNLHTTLDLTKSILTQRRHSPNIEKYWKLKFQSLDKNNIETWDYSLCYSTWKHNNVFVGPTKSLTYNIGLREGRVKRFHDQYQNSVYTQALPHKVAEWRHEVRDFDDIHDELVFGYVQGKHNLYRLLQTFIRSILETTSIGRKLL